MLTFYITIINNKLESKLEKYHLKSNYEHLKNRDQILKI